MGLTELTKPTKEMKKLYDEFVNLHGPGPDIAATIRESEQLADDTLRTKWNSYFIKDLEDGDPVDDPDFVYEGPEEDETFDREGLEGEKLMLLLDKEEQLLDKEEEAELDEEEEDELEDLMEEAMVDEDMLPDLDEDEDDKKGDEGKKQDIDERS